MRPRTTPDASTGTGQDPGDQIVSQQPSATIDLTYTDDTTLIATGYRDRILLASGFDAGSEGSGNSVFVSGDQSTVYIGGDGGGGGPGNAVYLSGRDDTVAGNGFPGSSDTIDALGKGAVITVGGNANRVLLGGTDATVTVVPTQVADSQLPFGSTDVVASGTGKATVTGGGANFSFSGAGGQYSVSGGSAVSSVISGGEGGGVFIGGYFQSAYKGGPNDAFLYDGSNVLTAGDLGSTLVGAAHGSSLLVAAGADRDVLIAGEYGTDTLSGGSATGNDIYQGYDGPSAPTDDPATPALVVAAGKGNDTLIAGLANETLTGGAGHDQFRFIDGEVARQTLITDFAPGTDKIDLRGYAVTSGQVVASETVRGGSTLLALPGDARVTLAHVTDLSAKDFTRS